MKKIYILGILAFLVCAVGSASAVPLSNSNIYLGTIPSGAVIAIDATYDATAHTITYVDTSTGVSDPRITWVGYNINTAASSVQGYLTTTDTTPATTDYNGPNNNFGALGVLGPLLSVYKQNTPTEHCRKVVVTVSGFDGTITGNNFGNQIGVHFVCNEFSGFYAGPGNNVRVPEFPSMALPVAGILGLMLILGRRNKE